MRANKKEAAGYKNVDGSVRYPLYDGDGKAYYRDRLTLKVNSEREKGERGYENEKGVEVGLINGKTYRFDKEGEELVLYEQGRRKEGAVVTKEGNNVKAIVAGRSKKGYEFSIELAGRTLGKVISEEEYEKGANDRVEKDVEYRINRVERISEKVYEKIKDRTIIKGSQTVRIGTLYEKSGNEWHLKEGAAEEDKKEIVKALKEARREGKVIIEEQCAGVGERKIREIGIFTAEERKEIGEEYFEAIGDEYQIKSGIGEAKVARLEKKLKRYESEMYDFPYFTHMIR
ncbi:hypothetical protein GWP43_00845 [Treponema vincentii]|uniref:Uncharacterized protein n=1 Tax=Treponema vincentii TaxID=69710 RepID=A0A6P1XXL9_9SPIR|nr:hypothetical protein [Treponema vincentii]QHX42238.1 hypothetical protein GWP43_00845 [Treponema vincentii]